MKSFVSWKILEQPDVLRIAVVSQRNVEACEVLFITSNFCSTCAGNDNLKKNAALFIMH